MTHLARQEASSRQTSREAEGDRFIGLFGAARRALQNRLNQRKCRKLEIRSS